MDDDFEFCGDCCVCVEPVDLSEMGNCAECGGVLHWGDCGGWRSSRHQCNACQEAE